MTNFLCCATHSGPIFHTVSYAVSCGIPLIAAVSIYSVEGLAGMGGRVAFGILGDRLGAKRVLVFGLLLQAFGALAYVFARELGTFCAACGRPDLDTFASYSWLYIGSWGIGAFLIAMTFRPFPREQSEAAPA
jgi:MFS family permease